MTDEISHKLVGVTFAVFNDKGEILMQLRDRNAKNYAGMWCIPGGTIDPGETSRQTAAREIEEEYSLVVDNPDTDLTFICELLLSNGRKGDVYGYKIKEGQAPELHEGEEMKWMSIEQIKNIELGFEQENIIGSVESFIYQETEKFGDGHHFK